MNKAINVILIFLLFPTMLMSIYVGLDLPISFLKTTGEYLPYKFEIFLGLGIFIFVLLLRRSIRRWMGMRIVSQQKKFKWNTEVSPERKRRVVTYLLLESFIMTSAAVALYIVCDEAWTPVLALIISSADNLFFAIIGYAKKGFRIGLSKKALIVADREVTLLYFKGLRKVSLHQQTIYFDYIKDLQLSFPTNSIQEQDKEKFYQILEKQMDPEKVFFSKMK